MSAALLVGILLAPAPAAAPPQGVAISEWTLSNGLQVAALRVTRMPVVAVQVFVHVGAKDEPEGKGGAARLVEQLMFEGSDHVPAGDHARLIARLGGSSAAHSGDDLTTFEEVVPRAHLDFVLRLEADRLRHLVFRPSMIASAKERLKAQLGVQEDHDPIGAALAALRAAAFTTHPYRRAPGGVPEELDRLPADELQRFYELYYQPGNVLLVVVGDVTDEEVRAAVDKHFGAIPRAPDPPRPGRDAREPPQTELRGRTAKPAVVGVVIGGWKIPEARSPDRLPLEVAVSILAGGESARLHQRLVRREKIGVAAGADLLATEDPGLLYAYGVHLAPEQGDRIEASLLAEVERLGRERVSTRELEKAKNQIIARRTFAQGDVASLARQIGAAKLLLGDAAGWRTDLEAVKKVTAADVQRVAKAYLQKTSATIVRVPPSAAQTQR